MLIWKYQALGNDYVVVDAADTPVPSAYLLQAICDRHHGVGADGVLYGPISESDGAFAVRIFNPDGGEAEKSGNGIRIFARYLKDGGYVSGDCGLVRSLGGDVPFRYLDRTASRIEMAMGQVSFWSDAIPVIGERREAVSERLILPTGDLTATCLTIGNPHCVVFTNPATPEVARTVGPLIERHPLFPNRTNVQFVDVLDRNSIRIEIWERGAGYTLASGTSTCAAASAAHRRGLVDARVQVTMPGGAMVVEIDGAWRVRLTGDVAPTFRGQLDPEFLAKFM
jgi:diaminopimelate epimerase